MSVYSGDVFRLLCLGNFGSPSATVIRKSIFDCVGGFDPSLRVAEDTELFHRLATFSPAAILMKSLVKCRIGQTDTLTGPSNTLICLRNALQSLEGARSRRGLLTDDEDKAWRCGRQQLFLELAYARLANFDAAGTREALIAYQAVGGGTNFKASALRVLSYLPAAVLRMLHAGKRMAV